MNRRIVRMKLLGQKDIAAQCLDQGRQQVMRLADPIAQGGRAQNNAGSLANSALPVEWQVVAIFPDQDVSQQCGTGEAAGDWT